MHVGKKPSSDDKKYPASSFMGRLRERKIIATLAAFIGGGWLTYEVVHWILVDHYHLPKILKDITIVTFLGALFSTVIWRWFRGTEKRPGNVKVEVLVVPLIILLTLVIDLKFIFVMTDVSINMLLIGIVALCLGIAWVVFKSLQWAASAPEAEKKVEVLKPEEKKPISFPEWEKSIVVLPFENISPEEGQDYFCDGMTEEIITDLSSIHDLRVISRSSAMMLKGSKKAVDDIAKELNVQYVLEGSVRKAGNNLRITAQLIEATSDAHLWAEKYSGTLDNVFDIQEKVSRSIVEALKVKLTPQENRKIAERLTDNIQAYECYLRAYSEMQRMTEPGIKRALRDLQNGLEIVGENALLYFGLGLAYLYLKEFFIETDEDPLKRAEDYASRVLELEPEASYAHHLLGMIEKWRGNVLKAMRHFKRALSIWPDSPDTLFWLSIYYAFNAGRASYGLQLASRLVDIDPLSPVNYFALGFSQWMGGRLNDALSSLEKNVQLDQENIYPRMFTVYVLMWENQLQQAFKLIDQLTQKKPSDGIPSWISALLLFSKYAFEKKSKIALETLSDDASRFCWDDPVLPWLVAGMYSVMDEKEEALRWLEHTIDRGCINYPLFAKQDPFLENIRDEPRFKKLMERVKHEWENFEV